ncbi:molybdopterin dinucleotide binding domain-containing protein [Pseudonocardia sp. ICBG162]|uniref:molybdopterin dinucleotide binding domain-containing protein n=2 Tax=unclassified Pseudonocardia TaxID=2619320 RepID=UPI001CF6CF3F|nr:molybdopterin dinucleotide binding domain-containing protein [Pseudonocardia sp. ICBG162]
MSHAGTAATPVDPTGHRPRICPLCEATCGLLVEFDGRLARSVRPNPHDRFSHGYACAKGLGLARLDGDPDRLTVPLVRRDGRLRETSWEEAFAEIGRRLPPLVAEDPQSVAVYTGNPAAHHLDHTLYLPALLGAIGSRNLFSPASMDTWPKNLVTALLYGTGIGMSLPDIDRTDHLLLLGSNPVVSNGSTVCAPGFARRLDDLRGRGGTLTVVDPARTRTAEMADRHLAIRPGTDAHLLMALLSVIDARGLADPGPAGAHVDGLDEVLALARPFTPERVAPVCGVGAREIEDLAIGFATAPAAVAHSRIGTCTQEYGSLANWLVEVLNIATGRLDVPGGAMFATPPAGGPTTWPRGPARPQSGRWRSRVRGLPEMLGELSVACLAEEILTPGPGQVRALITIAGNPARSVPRSAEVERALREVGFLLCLDTYLNETTRHADVVLPAPHMFAHGHMDLTLNHFQIRTVARYSPPALDPAPGEMPEWHQVLRIAAIVRGTPDLAIETMDDEIAAQAARRAGRLCGIGAEDVLAAVAPRRGPERLVDMRVRSGPFGDRFGAEADGLTLARLETTPDGVDLGPLEPRLPDVLRTPGSRVDVAPAVLTGDVPRLWQSLRTVPATELRLINRRQHRGMNSWLHNALPHRDDGPGGLMMHPADASRLGLVHGEPVQVGTGSGTVVAELRVSGDIRPGVVSLPHGWGHTGEGLRMTRAAAAPGANVNRLVDDRQLEPLTGTPVFNGVPVTVRSAGIAAPEGDR